MADSLKQFYANSNLSYTDLSGTGTTIASTTGSQKAVIKDIDISNPNGKTLKASIDDVTIATSTKTETLFGNVILDNSKAIKLSASEKPVWTSIRSAKGANTVNHYKNAILDDYFTLPASVITLAPQEDSQHAGGTALTSLEGTNQNDVTFWHADQMFNKPAGDMYYMSGWRDNNSNNKLNYYDASAGSASNLVALNASYLQWYSGYSNKYLIRMSNGSNKGSFQAWNTATNALTTVSTTLGGSGTTSADDYISSWSNSVGTMTCLDKYMFVRRDMSGQNSRDACMINIETGKKLSWTTGDDMNGSTPYKRNGGSYWDYIAPAQIVKNSAGNYYVLWMVVEGSGSGGHGLQIMDWSTDPDAVINANGSAYYTASSMASKSPVVAEFDTGDAAWNSLSWYTPFRVYDSASNYQGWGSGWCPLTKLTPTNSYSRYWMYANAEVMFLLDVDNITTIPKIIEAKVGTSTTKSFISGSGAPREAFTWTPYVDDTKIASGFGTIGCRTSGILET
tara:strand:+ start:1378 stop:2901 length:1524 start_codon:yes stop_codon:yes gene_type:complete